jgi:hypothetical protein
MNTHKILSCLTTLLILSTSAPILAQEATPKQATPERGLRHTVGFTAGVTTGLGLTYRGTLDKWSAQIAFMPAWTRENGGNFFAGTQVGRVVQGTDSFYLNVALGAGFMLTEDDVCSSASTITLEWVCTRQRDMFLAAGPSVGLGKIWGEHFQAEIYLPIAVVWELDEGLHSIVPYPGVTLGYIW